MTETKKQRSTKSARRKVKVTTTSRKNMTRPTKIAKEQEIKQAKKVSPKDIRNEEAPKEQKIKQSAKITKFNDHIIKEAKTEKVQIQVEKIKKEEISNTPMASFDMSNIDEKMRGRAKQRMEQKSTQPKMMSAREIKEQEIKKAISAANRSVMQPKKGTRPYKKMGLGFRRAMLATACAAVAIFAVVFLVSSQAPDASIRVAAMQSGIDARYPGYVPRDFNLTDITSENGKITLNFKNSATSEAFSIIEEKVDWRADDLYNKFVKSNYGANYTMISENGINIYIDGSDAAWIKDGIFYQIKTTKGQLTKKQISTIATKL